MDDAVQADQIEEVVMPVLRDHGLELVDIEWRPLRPRGVLRLFVDKPGGVGIGDCERLSRAIGDALGAAPVVEGACAFAGSPPGLGRVPRTARAVPWGGRKRVRWRLGRRR